MSTPTTYKPTSSLSSYLQTSQEYPEDTKKLSFVLSEMHNKISNAVNIRQIGIYDPQETETGQQWFSTNPQKKRSTYRTVISTTTFNAPVNHNIPNVVNFTLIGGTATDGTNFYPISYNDSANYIAPFCTTTQYTILSNIALTSAILILEVLKN